MLAIKKLLIEEAENVSNLTEKKIFKRIAIGKSGNCKSVATETHSWG
jgi:hypothetical protein